MTSATLLPDLQRLVVRLEKDLLKETDCDAVLRPRYQDARVHNRTAAAYEPWRNGELTQVAVAWVLAGVFTRFLEDNGLVEPALGGPGERLDLARERHADFIRRRPADTYPEYFRERFLELAALPGLDGLFGQPARNPLWLLTPSPDFCRDLLTFWQRRDPADPAGARPAHDFTDPEWDTRFLGDLYQDLSDHAKKTFALLQTPRFVEAFLLDRTLEPAIAEAGDFRVVRLIDPACGSGHLLLGAFARLMARYNALTAMNPPERARAALAQLAGVDKNPFAVAIARFRLLVAALRESGVERLAEARDFGQLFVTTGDSLLLGPRPGGGERQGYLSGNVPELRDPLADALATEDPAALRHILGRQYHAVVANPPYITVKDATESAGYRARFISCHGKYSLAAPFAERLFDLALTDMDPDTGARRPAGFVGMITANSFMKREFGKKLVEVCLPRWDLTHVIDTSGAYLPGHGTPTVILFGRHRRPVAPTVRAVMGIAGEPATPSNPAKGLVWTAIVGQVGRPGSHSEWVSVADVPREGFGKHPWSIGGGGAAGLKERMDEAGKTTLANVVETVRKRPNIGFASFPGLDEAFILDRAALRRHGVPDTLMREMITGDVVRDWLTASEEWALAPYDKDFAVMPLEPDARWGRLLWLNRHNLRNVVSFGDETREDLGQAWWGWYRWIPERYRRPLSITIGEVATHNHFVLDRGGKVFKQTAPVIKLPANATEDDHLGLLGLLNSSVACFWLKQVCFPKGGDQKGGEGARVRTTLWDERYAFNATPLAAFPVAAARPLALARELDRLGRELAGHAPAAVLARWINPATVPAENGSLPAALDAARAADAAVRGRMVALQEELDWFCLHAYGLLDADLTLPADAELPALRFGERAFEILLARGLDRTHGSAPATARTTWFERHNATPITELPAAWSAPYRDLVARRVALLERDRDTALVERPEHKRRWNAEPWPARETRALKEWLLTGLEAPALWADGALRSTAELADRLPAPWLVVAERLRGGRRDFSVPALVAELVGAESVPLLPGARLRASGLEKRAVWERVWAAQREEDALNARVALPVGDPARLEPSEAAVLRRERGLDAIPVPPRYGSGDFRVPGFWRLRGKLDVPRERFFSLPGAERDGDGSPVVGWAGWDHLQRAQAIAAHYEDARTVWGWPERRLLPLLAALGELVPWLQQWHNALDPAFGARLGDYFAEFTAQEAQRLGFTLAQVRAAAVEPG